MNHYRHQRVGTNFTEAPSCQVAIESLSCSGGCQRVVPLIFSVSATFVNSTPHLALSLTRGYGSDSCGRRWGDGSNGRGRGGGDPPDVDAMVVIEVNPPNVNPEGDTRIAAMIAGMSFVVKGQGVVVERRLCFRGSSSVSWLSPEVWVLEGDWREAVAFFLGMELRRAIADSFD